MANEQDATLLLQAFQIRNSEAMQKARNYMIFEFFPRDRADFQPLFADPNRIEHNNYYQMVTSYWDMMAAFVNQGILDANMFSSLNSEHLAIWSKIVDFLPYLRQKIFGEQYLLNLQQLVENDPDAARATRAFQERFKRISATKASQPQTQAEPALVE